MAEDPTLEDLTESLTELSVNKTVRLTTSPVNIAEPKNPNNSRKSENENDDEFVNSDENYKKEYIKKISNIYNIFCEDFKKINNEYIGHIDIKICESQQFLNVSAKLFKDVINFDKKESSKKIFSKSPRNESLKNNNELPLINNNSEQISESSKKSKKLKTLYWAVDIDNFNNDEINNFLKNKEHLIPLKKIHSTLLFVGKKDNDDEKVFINHNEKKCSILVSEFGYSNDALCIKVDEILFENNEKVPSFAVQQHITFALREGIKAKDSVKALLGEGTIKQLEIPVMITGYVKKYLY